MDAQGRNGRGFTLVEVLATLAIIGVLASLALPAVMRARSAVRRIDCGSRLAQVGVAMASYADVCGRFASTDQQSLWVNLAPWLGVAPDGLGLRRDGGYDAAIHAALARRLQCPAMRYNRIARTPTADGLYPLTSSGYTSVSYVGNAGPHVPAVFYGSFDAGGTVTAWGVRPAEIVDGLSRTALVSELVVTADIADEAAGRNVCYGVNDATSAEDLAARCLTEQFPTGGTVIGFGYTMTTLWGDALYCHGVPPGARSCYANGSNGFSDRFSLIAANSAHDEVVNVLLCDGSVQTYSFSVALPIWRALGTRAGGEAF